jgi:hypothetical protein
MTVKELIDSLQELLTENPDFQDLEVVCREYKPFGDIPDMTIAFDTPLVAILSSVNTNELCLLSTESADVYEKMPH